MFASLSKYMIACCLIAFCCVQASGVEPAKDRHVIVICVDGLAAYLLNDPKAPLPAIRNLAKHGAVIEEGMRVVNPSVTWPNHTTLVTGVRPEVHSVIANGTLVRGAPNEPVKVDPRKDKGDLVKALTVYDAAHAAGLITADINWPCTRKATTLHDSFPDVPDQITHTTPRLREELVAKGILLDETDKSFMQQSPPGRDLIWTEAACHVIRQRKPNLMFIHLLNVDAIHHAEGAQSNPGYTANAYADSCVARILQAIDDAGIREQTTVLIVADHGFTLTPQAILPNVLLRQAKLLETSEKGAITQARVNVVPEGGVGLVYCNDPSQVEADRKRVIELFTGKEGVAEVLTPEQFAEHGLPHPRRYAHAPDLVLVAKDGYGVSALATGEAFVAPQLESKIPVGSHGFISANAKMNAICIFSGNGIRVGARLKQADNIDIAPTIAKLLSLPNFPAEGRVLREVLAE